ncbi:MAG: hypothetical protein LBE13_08035 [Bacteroidales bacterium]|jgi:hypothetical protein|nr:hypothetical protein [Bacteroidales bacterium]
MFDLLGQALVYGAVYGYNVSVFDYPNNRIRIQLKQDEENGRCEETKNVDTI